MGKGGTHQGCSAEGIPHPHFFVQTNREYGQKMRDGIFIDADFNWLVENWIREE
jgi:hypothetical protein